MKEKLFFKSSKGNKLCGILSNPTVDKDRPIIILCHGFSSSKDGRTYLGLEAILNRKGVSIFRFDFFGHGESQGLFENITTSEAVDDVLNAIEFLRKSGYTKIGLMGSSFGGLASLLAASQSGVPYVLVLKSPVSDYKGMALTQKSGSEIQNWKETGVMEFKSANNEKIRLGYAFYEEAKNIRVYEAAPNIKVPTLIVHGEMDETVPVEQSRKVASLIPKANLITISECDHAYSNPELFDKLLNLISRYIIENS
ncbi:MAG TPA: alpha/beta fold hydrolase [Acidobacteriota bacterium]|nr:alpha/beta fold hydrolase [Acidobacteriota bacterium]